MPRAMVIEIHGSRGPAKYGSRPGNEAKILGSKTLSKAVVLAEFSLAVRLKKITPMAVKIPCRARMARRTKAEAPTAARDLIDSFRRSSIHRWKPARARPPNGNTSG